MALPTAEVILYASPWAIILGIFTAYMIQKDRAKNENHQILTLLQISENLHRLAYALHGYSSNPDKPEKLQAKIKITLRELEDNLDQRYKLLETGKESMKLKTLKHRAQGFLNNLFQSHPELLDTLVQEMDLKNVKLFLRENPGHKSKRHKKVKLP
jgi:flagellar motility protein MotE (MotC chaperone)